MKYRKETTAICYSESLVKQCALFHNHVIPIGIYNVDKVKIALPHILPSEINSQQLTSLYKLSEDRLERLIDEEFGNTLSIESEKEYELEWQLSFLIDYHRRRTPLPVCATHGKVPGAYYDVNSEYNNPYPAEYGVDHIFGQPEHKKSKSNITVDSEPAIILSNLDLIDANKLTWDQIIEIRKDTHSMNALKDLRMFLYREFKHEDSIDYIEDTLLQLMRRYKETADKWGFDTMIQSLKIGLNKAMVLGIGSSLAAVLFDATLPIAAAAGFAASVGELGIKFSERHREKKDMQKKNPVHYLIELNKLSSKK